MFLLAHIFFLKIQLTSCLCSQKDGHMCNVWGLEIARTPFEFSKGYFTLNQNRWGNGVKYPPPPSAKYEQTQFTEPPSPASNPLGLGTSINLRRCKRILRLFYLAPIYKQSSPMSNPWGGHIVLPEGTDERGGVRLFGHSKRSPAPEPG